MGDLPRRADLSRRSLSLAEPARTSPSHTDPTTLAASPPPSTARPSTPRRSSPSHMTTHDRPCLAHPRRSPVTHRAVPRLICSYRRTVTGRDPPSQVTSLPPTDPPDPLDPHQDAPPRRADSCSAVTVLPDFPYRSSPLPAPPLPAFARPRLTSQDEPSRLIGPAVAPPAEPSQPDGPIQSLPPHATPTRHVSLRLPASVLPQPMPRPTYQPSPWRAPPPRFAPTDRPSHTSPPKRSSVPTTSTTFVHPARAIRAPREVSCPGHLP